MPEQTRTSWFQNSGSRAWAVVAIAAGVAVAVLFGMHGVVAGVPAGLLFALIAYSSLWRPAIGLGDREVVLRGMYSAIVLPESRIETVVWGRMLEVTVAGKRYRNAALTGSRRQGRRESRDGQPAERAYVEAELRGRLDQRWQTGGEEPVRREWARIDIALTILLAVALVVTILV